MKILNSFSDFIENKFAPPLVRISENIYLLSIRDGAMASMPFFIIGSVILMICFFPVDAWLAIAGPGSQAFGIIFPMFSMTMGVVSIYVTCAVAHSLSKRRKVDPLMGIIVSLMVYLYLAAPMTDGALPSRYMDANGFIIAILSPILAIELYRFLINKGIIIKMPLGVPPVVAKPFEGLIPMTIILLLVWVLGTLLGLDIPALLTMILTPVLSATDSLLGMIVVSLIEMCLWFVGIHGSAIVRTGILNPLLMPFLAANQAAFEAGTALPHIITPTFSTLYITTGGTGATLALPFMLLFAKSKRLKRIGALSIVPAIFGINEPLLFGIPLVLNPLFLVPLMSAGAITGTIAYIATDIGLVGKSFSFMNWTMPAPLHAFLSTADWKAPILVIICTCVAGLIYYPFLRIQDKKLYEEEMAAERAAATDTN